MATLHVKTPEGAILASIDIEGTYRVRETNGVRVEDSDQLDRTNHWTLIKCFQTAEMPEFVYNSIAEILSDGDGGDTATYCVGCEKEWLEDKDDPQGSYAVYRWFRENGARDGEWVILERGTWPKDRPNRKADTIPGGQL